MKRLKNKIKNVDINDMELLISVTNLLNLSDWNNFLNKMNKKTKSVTINQIMNNKTDLFSYEGKDRVYSFKERGASKSRNKALEYSNSDICIMCDDDVTYVDDYEQIIKNAYKENPSADVIIFYVESLNEKRKNKIIPKGKVNKITLMRIVTPEITFKRKSIIENNIKFDNRFGSGAKWNRGEETIFVAECLEKGLNVISMNIKIATAENEISHWYEQVDKEFLKNQGIVFGRIYPKLYPIINLQFVIRKYNLYKNYCNIIEAYKCLNSGVKIFKREEKNEK